MIRRWLAERADRRAHNDRDFECVYWWGDRGGYSSAAEKCAICREFDRVVCDHEWRVFHGISGDHAKCLRCGVGGDITIRERTNR